MRLPVAAEFANIRILLIEDQLFIRSMMARMLNGIGFKHVLQARDGQEALDLIAADREFVDVILCDLKMPNMDGFDFLAKLRELPTGSAQNPVVMLTASNDPESVDRLKELGIAGYIVKPASTQMVVEGGRVALRAAKRGTSG